MRRRGMHPPGHAMLRRWRKKKALDQGSRAFATNSARAADAGTQAWRRRRSQRLPHSSNTRLLGSGTALTAPTGR